MVEGLITKKVDRVFKYSAEETELMILNLDETVAMQKELGFGNPAEFHERMSSDAKRMKSIKAIKEMVDNGDFDFIEEPDAKHFPRFAGGEVAKAGVTFSKTPGFVMLKLAGATKSVECSVDRDTFKAAVPIFPRTALELAKRVKDKAPDAEFHLIYEPSWEKQPQMDPVLVAKISSNYWISVAQWDSDSQIISELLVKKQ
jgi:hypothetical protein